MAATSSASTGAMTGAPADYQRFSSPPVTHFQSASSSSNTAGAAGSGDGYQRFTSPPGTSSQQQQGMGSMYNQQQGFAGQQQQQQGASFQQQGGPNGSHAPWNQFGVMNDATAQMGMQFGRSAVQAGQDYMNRNVGPFSYSLPYRQA